MFKNRHWSLLAVGIIVLGSCSPEHELDQKDSSHFPSQNKPTALRLRYELEAVTHREVLTPGDQKHLTFLDEIASEPVASRHAVDMVVFQDGSTDYLIEEQEPQHVSLPNDFEGVPANDLAPVAKTKITGGMAYFYDELDNLLYEHPMEEDYAMRDQITRLTGEYDWEAEAKAESAEIEAVNETTILIRKPLPEEPTTEGPALRKAGRYTEEVIVPDLNLFLGSSLHEASGEVISRMAYKYAYQEENEKWIPELMYYEEYSTNEVTGSAYVSKTTYYYDNYSLQTN